MFVIEVYFDKKDAVRPPELGFPIAYTPNSFNIVLRDWPLSKGPKFSKKTGAIIKVPRFLFLSVQNDGSFIISDEKPIREDENGKHYRFLRIPITSIIAIEWEHT